MVLSDRDSNQLSLSKKMRIYWSTILGSPEVVVTFRHG